MSIIMKSSLILLETSGPVQGCTGIAVSFALPIFNLVDGRSQWSRGLRRGSEAARAGGMDVCVLLVLCVVR